MFTRSNALLAIVMLAASPLTSTERVDDYSFLYKKETKDVFRTIWAQHMAEHKDKFGLLSLAVYCKDQKTAAQLTYRLDLEKSLVTKKMINAILEIDNDLSRSEAGLGARLVHDYMFVAAGFSTKLVIDRLAELDEQFADQICGKYPEILEASDVLVKDQ